MGRPGAILAHLGAILKRLGRVLDSQNLLKRAPRPPKMSPKTRSNIALNLEAFETQKKNVENVERGALKNMCLAMNGKRAKMNNISKHVVLFSSRLSVLSYFSFYCYSIASPRSAWHCMPALRALRSLRSLARFARSSMLLTVLAPSWPFLAPSWDVLAQSWHVLAPSWRVLAPSWAVLAKLGPS